ncbi:hypothetical protein Hypma_008165 [Hypsizygus marmoreus]|uniref:Uncharacterized protein n=1 Tax=Hypsizygus marmoreus TaxID=39966 RepID=A0A369JQS0_HYPMA|nr:hypothetical protein Hypma_008165 [Hypsizygus marmoreus]
MPAMPAHHLILIPLCNAAGHVLESAWHTCKLNKIIKFYRDCDRFQVLHTDIKIVVEEEAVT